MPDLKLLITLLPVAFALHNLEETLGMEKWTHSLRSPVLGTVTTRQFGISALLITALGFGVILGRDLIQNDQVYFEVVAGFAGMLCLNVLFPHVLATLYYGRYAPGVVTALLINLPLTLMLLYQLHDAQTLTNPQLTKSVIIGGLAGILLVYGLLKLGRALDRLF
ncbi:MAG TPA: HXXEE domain-containing protein [Cyclobacteriaceae bacterium]|nr:HXXEE domain-containing protein [Cyclobacteriaceae bacterium]